MNWEYITGFFDADGSVSLAVVDKRCNRTLQISFHNTVLSILEGIKDFILKDIGVLGHISTKRKREEHHKVSYDLKYTYAKAFKLSCKIKSKHPIKKQRIEIYKDIQEKTKRNGKYSEEEAKERALLVEKFFEFN